MRSELAIFERGDGLVGGFDFVGEKRSIPRFFAFGVVVAYNGRWPLASHGIDF